MHREYSALRAQPRSNDSRNVSDRFFDLERAGLREGLAQVLLGTTPRQNLRVLTSRAPVWIARLAFFDAEIQRDEWTADPVEQSGRKTVMLGYC